MDCTPIALFSIWELACIVLYAHLIFSFCFTSFFIGKQCAAAAQAYGPGHLIRGSFGEGAAESQMNQEKKQICS
ncbi:hypothetical protein Scep_020560 [Stephania cephalantha]|uniref:Uncharacterized protein n=1 Tax=Stephania cephalantha TaxID=152367 RepID=A0AAP0IDY2_9MAGN